MFNLIDLIGRIKNAISRGKLEVEVKNSKFIRLVLDCLIKEGYIRGYYKKERELIVLLKYKEQKSVIEKLKIISKPSKKVYYSYKQLKKSYWKGENYIVSSSKGIFMNKECIYKEQGEGGIVLIEIN